MFPPSSERETWQSQGFGHTVSEATLAGGQQVDAVILLYR